MGGIASLFHQDSEQFFETHISEYSSFWDWFVRIRLPWDANEGHFHFEPAFFANEVEIYTLAILTFIYAYRRGSRYLYLWFAIVWHGFTVELVSYWVEPIDNFWHAQSTFVFFGRREPMQIVLVYPSYLFIAAIVVERMGLTELTEACTMGLMVVLIDFPYDIMGIKLLFWTWHDTDSNLYDRSYWVPISSYYFHATFACSFSLIYNYSRRYFVGISGLHGEDDLEQRYSYGRRALIASNWKQELKACACAGLFSMPCGILQFVPIFHYFGDVWNVHAEVTMFTLGAIYCSVMFYGVNHSKPMNVLEMGEREERKGSKKFGNGKWYYDEIVLAILIHFLFYSLLVVFANPQTYQVYGLHQEIGSPPGSKDKYDCSQTREVTYPYPFTPAAFPSFLRADWFQNVTVTKRPYICPNLELFDEGYFDFHCERAKNQTLIPGQKFYWICGTDWTNTDNKTSWFEYVLIIWMCSIVGIHALIQPLIYPRTVFEQFFVNREFPKYFKYNKPNRNSSLNGLIKEYRVENNTGKEQFLIEQKQTKKTSWVDRSEFENSPLVGEEYMERGGLYGQLHDTYGKSTLDRTRTFLSLKHSIDRLNWREKASKVKGISYEKGYPTSKHLETPKERNHE